MTAYTPGYTPGQWGGQTFVLVGHSHLRPPFRYALESRSNQMQSYMYVGLGLLYKANFNCMHHKTYQTGQP